MSIDIHVTKGNKICRKALVEVAESIRKGVGKYFPNDSLLLRYNYSSGIDVSAKVSILEAFSKKILGFSWKKERVLINIFEKPRKRDGKNIIQCEIFSDDPDQMLELTKVLKENIVQYVRICEADGVTIFQDHHNDLDDLSNKIDFIVFSPDY